MTERGKKGDPTEKEYRKLDTEMNMDIRFFNEFQPAAVEYLNQIPYLDPSTSVHEQIFTMVSEPTFLPNAIGYWMTQLELDSYAEDSQKHAVAAQQLAEKTGRPIPNSTQELIARIQPLQEATVRSNMSAEYQQTRDRIAAIAKLPNPLSADAMRTLDDIFLQENTIPIQEKALLLTLGFYNGDEDKTMIQLFRKSRTSNPDNFLAAGDNLRSYLETYAKQLLAYNTTRTDGPDFTYLRQSLTPVAIAFQLSNVGDHLFPTSYNELIAPAIRPVLDPSLQEELKAQHKRKFDQTNAKLYTKVDDIGFFPYVLATQSYQTGAATRYLQRIEQRYVTDAAIKPNPDSRKQLLANYKRLASYVDTAIFTIGSDIDIASFAIGSTRERNFLDLLITSPQEETVLIQIDENGNTAGIPADFTGDIDGVLNMLFEKTIHFAQEEEILPNIRPKIIFQKQELKPAKNTEQAVPPWFTEEVKVVSKNKKRKALRREGLLPPEESIVPEEATRAEKQKPYKIQITLPAETIAHLPEAIQGDIIDAVTYIEATGVDVKKVKKLGRRQNTPRFRIRQGDWRIFVELNTEDLTKGTVRYVRYRDEETYDE